MSNTEPEQNNPPVEGVDSVRPEGLPENFTSVADLAKSYNELQGTFTRDRQELAEIKGTLAEMQATYAQANEGEQQDPAEQWAEATGFDTATVTQIAQIADAIAKQNLQTFAQQQGPVSAQQQEAQNHLIAYTADQIVGSRYDDWNDYKTKVAEAVQQDPDLLPQAALTTPEQTARALERVYKLVKADDAYNQTQDAGTLADQGRQNKVNAQTMTGAAGRPETPSDDEEWFERLQAARQQGYSARRGGV